MSLFQNTVARLSRGRLEQDHGRASAFTFKSLKTSKIEDLLTAASKKPNKF
jgi:hypothetical protein